MRRSRRPQQVGDRDALVSICMDIADRRQDVDSGLWQRMHRLLGEVGVRAVVPDGEPFDEKLFEAVGRADTTDETLQLTVQSTRFCGYVDGHRLLRKPQVIVYRTEEVLRDA